MSKIGARLNRYKKAFCEKSGCSVTGLVSDSELLVEWQDKLAPTFKGGHAEYWIEIIKWADKRFALIGKLPMSCYHEKAALIAGLSGYDNTKLSEKDYETLLIKLHQTLNKPSKDAYTLVANRAKAVKARSKRSLEIDAKICARMEVLQKTIKLKKIITQTLVEEFNLSSATIRRALKNM